MLANPIPWPDGCRCAVAITFDMDADSILHLAHPDSADNRVMALSMLRYGPQVAIPRILDIYRRFGMQQTDGIAVDRAAGEVVGRAVGELDDDAAAGGIHGDEHGRSAVGNGDRLG